MVNWWQRATDSRSDNRTDSGVPDLQRAAPRALIVAPTTPETPMGAHT
jgi:hypothetical protein